MKKVLVMTLLVLMLAVFAACGNNGDDAADNTLTIWCWDPAFNVFAMQEAAAIFQRANPDVEINIIEVDWYDIQTAIITAATANQLNTLPDIMLIQDNAFQMHVMSFPEVFIDLTDSGINFNEFATAKAGMSMVNGRNFGVPFDNGTTIGAFRTDILAQAGLTIDDFTDVTWNEFIDLGRIVLAETGMPMISTVAGGGDYINFMIQSAGASVFNPDGTPNIAGNPAIIEAVNIFQELVAAGVLLEVNNWDEYIGSFVNGTVAGTIAGCWILGSIQTATDQAGNWAVTNVPRLNIPSGTNYSNWGGSSWAVTSNAANPDLAIDFLNYTFAGSVELYDIILPAAGALSTWAPAAASVVYQEPQPFFGGQTVFSDIIRFSGNVPSVTTGVFFYEARDAIGFAVVNILGGADMTQELQAAQDQVLFQMGQ